MENDLIQECIDLCLECAIICENCSTACLYEEDVKMMERCIMLDRDCKEICILTAGAITRDSEFTQEFCTLCAEICDACADECEKHEAEHCKVCAEVCRECSEACRNVSNEAA